MMMTSTIFNSNMTRHDLFLWSRSSGIRAYGYICH